VASVFRLRKKPGYAPSFKVPWYPFVPLLFISSVLYLLGNALLQPESRWSTAGALGLVAAGIPVYYLFLRPKSS
jgi:L-asparagine transporter-like permease